MAKVIVKWDSNWDDEMDISGFTIISEEEAIALKTRLKERKTGFEICVGTNEDIDYSSGADLLDELTFTKISDDEARIIEKRIGDEYGFTHFMSAIEDWEDEEEYDGFELGDNDYVDEDED